MKNKIFFLSIVSILIVVLVCFQTYMKLNIFSYNKPLNYQPLRIYTNVTDSSLWKYVDQSHGFHSNDIVQTYQPICNDFFILWYYLYLSFSILMSLTITITIAITITIVLNL